MKVNQTQTKNKMKVRYQILVNFAFFLAAVEGRDVFYFFDNRKVPKKKTLPLDLHLEYGTDYQYFLP